MDFKFYKNEIIIPFCFNAKNFGELEVNSDVICKDDINVHINKTDKWIRNEALYLFDSDSKDFFYNRFYVNCDMFKPLVAVDADNIGNRKISCNRKIFFIKGMEDVKFSIDRVQLWLMRSGNGFVTFNTNVVNAFDKGKESCTISDKTLYELMYKLKLNNDIFCYQNVSRDESKLFKFNLREYVDVLLKDYSNIEKIDSMGCACSTLLLNYVVTDEFDSDEVDYLLYDIDRNLNPTNFAHGNKSSIDESKVYYNGEYRYKWIATDTSITMIGDSANTNLISNGGIMCNVFDRHLCLFLYYEGLNMTCNKAEGLGANIGNIKLIFKGDYTTECKILTEMLKCEDIVNKIAFLNKVANEDRDNLERYLYNGQINFLGGIANGGVESTSEQLNIIYAYLFAIRRKNINLRAGDIIERLENVKAVVRDGVIRYAKLGLEVAKLI